MGDRTPYAIPDSVPATAGDTLQLVGTKWVAAGGTGGRSPYEIPQIIQATKGDQLYFDGLRWVGHGGTGGDRGYYVIPSIVNATAGDVLTFDGSSWSGATGTPAPTGNIVAWWDFTNTATTFSDTAGTTPAVDGGNLSCVKDARGGSNPSAVASAGSSGYVGDGGGVHPLTYHSADVDGKPYGLIPSFGDQMLISSASLTYNAVLVVIRAGDSEFSFNGDRVFDDSQAGHTSGLLNGYLGSSTFAGQDNGFSSKIPTGGTFYAEDGTTGAVVDAVHSQIAGTDEYHVAAVLYASPRTGFAMLGNQWSGFGGFPGGRYKEVILLSGADDATVKANFAYLRAKHCGGYTSKQVYFDGDSIFAAGAILTSIGQMIPQRVMQILADGGISSWHLQNAAIGGQTLEDMVARQQWNIVDKFPQRSKNVVVAMEWVNSYLGGKTAAQINSSVDSYRAPVVAASAPILFCTPTFIGNETTSGMETDRQTIRSHIIAAGSYSDVGGPLSPFGQVVLGGPCNPRYYDDGGGVHAIHPTDDGTAVIANIIATDLGPILATADSVSNPTPSVLHAIVDPATGAASTAVAITVYAANLPATVSGVKVGGVAATSVVRQAGWRVDFTTPASLGAGTYDIEIDYPGGSRTITGGYTAQSSLPSLGTLAGWYKGSVGYGGGTWNDQSGNGNHLTLTGTSAGAGLNSLSTVLFNGSTDCAIRASMSMPATTGLTIGIVVNIKSGISFAAVCSYNGNAHVLFEDPSGFGDASHTAYVNGGSNSTPVANLNPTPTGFKRLVTTEDNSSPFNMFYNVNNVATGAGVASATRIATAQALCIGARASSNSPSNIDVAEIVVYGSVLSGTDLTTLDNYFKAKYGL